MMFFYFYFYFYLFIFFGGWVAIRVYMMDLGVRCFLKGGGLGLRGLAVWVLGFRYGLGVEKLRFSSFRARGVRLQGLEPEVA